VTARVEAEQRLSASVRQLEALTALATAVKNPREADQLFAGLADSITRFTDYRTSLVTLFADEPPYHPRVISYSANVPAEYVERFGGAPYPRGEMARAIEAGVRIEVGELGFAAYYPPSHYHLLDEIFPDRFKAELPAPTPAEGARWREGDELFVPLVTREGEYVGFISLDDPRSGRAPDHESVLPVVAFARQVTQLLAQQRAADELAEQAEREAIINRLTRAVRRSLDPAEVFSTAVNELGSHLNIDRCVLYVLDREAGVARNVAEYVAPGVSPAGREYPVPLIAGLIEGIRAHGVLTFDDAANDPRLAEVYDKVLAATATRSIMYAAITVGDDTRAAFAISTSRSLRRWREPEVALARAAADQTGIAIRQAELYQRAEATSEREALINRLSQSIRASLNLPDVLHTATHELGRSLRASRVYIRPYDPSRSEMSPVEHEYLAPGVRSVADINISNANPIGEYLRGTLRSLIIDDASSYEAEAPGLKAQVRRMAELGGVRSKVYCPLVVQGRYRGTLCIHQTDRVRRWTKDEVTLVEAVAAQLVIGIAQAELFEMVARAKQAWEATFDAMSDGVFIFDNSCRLMRVNRAGAAMEGVPPKELVGRGCCDILRAGGGEGCVIERAIGGGRAVTIEYTPERLQRPLVVTAEPVSDRGGTVGTVCTVRDLSELRKAERVARERQSLLENILESARESIYALDPEGRFQWCNSASTAMSGYRPEQIIGHHFLEMTHEADRPAVAEHFARALAGESRSYEVRYVAADGAVRCALIDNSPLIIDGRITGVLGISRDITEQKQERERAAQADKLRALG
ncbi:MAG: PAS domain-containing protein, partial [Pyrinomonadaceae bacterium]